MFLSLAIGDWSALWVEWSCVCECWWKGAGLEEQGALRDVFGEMCWL